MLNSWISIREYLDEMMKRLHEMLKSRGDVMQNGVTPRISRDDSLLTIENMDRHFSAFDDRYRSFLAKLKNLSANERSIFAARLRSYWPPAEPSAAMRLNE